MTNERWEELESRAFLQALERTRPRDRSSPVEILLWGVGKGGGWLHKHQYSQVDRYTDFDRYLRKNGMARRSGGRGCSRPSEVLRSVAPSKSFCLSELVEEIESHLKLEKRELVNRYVGLPGLAAEDFEKGLLKSAIAAHGFDRRGTVVNKDARLWSVERELPGLARDILRRDRGTIRKTLGRWPHVDGYRTDPKDLAEIQVLQKRRWSRLAAPVIRSFLIELLALCTIPSAERRRQTAFESAAIQRVDGGKFARAWTHRGRGSHGR